MARWLVKSEPGAWSWDDQVRDGVTAWTGVRNYQASNFLKAMKVGDLAFFYHSVDEKRIVGIVEVAREHYPDPTAEPGSPWVVVDVRAVEPLKTPVTLADVKAEKSLAEMALLKQSRLSVQPVTAAEWKTLCRMGGVKS